MNVKKLKTELEGLPDEMPIILWYQFADDCTGLTAADAVHAEVFGNCFHLTPSVEDMSDNDEELERFKSLVEDTR